MTDNTEHTEELPGRLAARRKTLGISQATAAQRANVTLRTWQRWETGATRAHFGHLPKMASALETTPEELLGVADAETEPRALEDLRLEVRLAAIEAKLDAVLAALATGKRPTLTLGDTQQLLGESDALLQQEGVAEETPKVRRSQRRR